MNEEFKETLYSNLSQDEILTDNPPEISHSNIELIRLEEVCQLVGLSKATVWAKLNNDSRYYDADFPKQIRISRRAVAWDKAEIMNWIVVQKNKR